MPIAVPPPSLCTPVPDWRIRLILQAVHAAWEQLLGHRLAPGAKPFEDADFQDEDTVTAHLVDILNKMLAQETHEWFTRRYFETISRDGKVTNYNGKHPDKMPDMVFRPSFPEAVPDQNYGIFVECKVIGGGRNMGHYVTEGIRRFVIGDYAWVMSRAIMVGYVNSNRHLPQGLQSYFRRRGLSHDAVACRPLTPPQPAADGFPPTCGGPHCTSHSRSFFVGTLEPGNIEVIHVWLGVPPEAEVDAPAMTGDVAGA